MDHNIVNITAWSPSTNTTGPITALPKLNTATASWSRVPNLNYTYDTADEETGTKTDNNYGALECENGICVIGETTITGTAKARMITGE